VLTGEQIDADKLIDQHYYAIASKATILKPHQLNVPVEKFKKQFGLDWQTALDSGKVMNALDACAEFGISADEMDKQWGVCKKGGTVRVFRQEFTLEDAIGSHACSLEVSRRVTNGIPLRNSFSYRFAL
jgi:hypothetical protein